MYSIDDLKVLLTRAAACGGIDWNEFADADWYNYTGNVIAKERPRVGKNGRVFTAPATRQFEADIKKWGKAEGMVPLTHPIRCTLILYDQCDDPYLIAASQAGLIFEGKKDIDNMAKAVFDGLNKIAYKDDKLIVNMSVRREYREKAGFYLAISRAGLSKTEASIMMKLIRMRGGLTGE